LFVYLRHAGNAWRFECGDFLDPAGWSPADEPRLDREDRAFYVARSTAAPDAAAPLVSCVMPTADRRAFVPHAIRYFLRQDHPNRELIVVDDGRDAVRDLVPADPRIHYVRLETPIVLGAKRNRACELARGDVVVHWDDDDWSAPHRISYQLAELERTGASVVGLSEQLYVEPRMRAAWVYRYPADRRPWVAGNTLCFRRELWARHPFPEVAVGEDTRFIWSATAGSILPLADHDFLVGVIHERNASRKRTADPFWAPVVLAEVERVLGDDAPIYLGAS
jgi:glycosyltransferase involved in cell wall biosynthesis